jgi:hypothetical protein
MFQSILISTLVFQVFQDIKAAKIKMFECGFKYANSASGIGNAI